MKVLYPTGKPNHHKGLKGHEGFFFFSSGFPLCPSRPWWLNLASLPTRYSSSPATFPRALRKLS